MSEELAEVVENTLPEETGTSEDNVIDMGMSDEEFENSNFDSEPQIEEEVKEEIEEEEAPTESSQGIEETGSEDEPVVEEKEFDKSAAYDEIMADFTANGKNVSVSTPAEVRRLMEMGAGFNKKMAGIKSDKKFIKMLQNHDLLSEEKISYLIDLDKKNPDAIAKLLRDGEINPMDLDTDENAEYKPNAYTVDDSQVQLDDVLEDLQDSKAYATTIDIVGTKWDESSRETLANDPKLIRSIHSHVELGFYDQIASVVENERMLGKLQGVDDFTAYKTVGDAMYAQGAFNKKPTANAIVNVPAPAKKTSPNVNDKKRAASSPKSKPKGKSEQFSITDMSDDEFEKKFGGL